MKIKSLLSYKKIIRLFKNIFMPEKAHKLSYSQCGEDLIIDFIFQGILKIPKPGYIDIGANDPMKINNTYLLYKKGSRGVCIEPDPELFKKLASKRKGDVCLNIGIGTDNKTEADYFVMTTKTLNTFSEVEAKNYETTGNYGAQKIEKVIKIPLVSINSLCEKYFTTYGNLVSLDVEGLDLEIIKAMDLKKYRPEVFCVESARCESNNKVGKDQEIINLLKANNYVVYADTFINTILIDKNKWNY